MAIRYTPTSITIYDDTGTRPPIVLPPTATQAEVDAAAATYSTPGPDWVGFDLALQNDPAIVATINDLGRLSQVATLSLGHALEEAEKGNLDRFLPIWQEWIIATNPPAAALERFRTLAAQCNLPAEFQAAIAAPPAGPAVAP